VQVAAHEAHLRAAPRVLGRVALRGGHHVDRGDRSRTRLLGREGERAVDSPHRAHVGEGRAGREPAHQLLARRRPLTATGEPAPGARGGDPGAGEDWHGRALSRLGRFRGVVAA
jgi:hypothetical protein